MGHSTKKIARNSQMISCSTLKSICLKHFPMLNYQHFMPDHCSALVLLAFHPLNFYHITKTLTAWWRNVLK